MLPEKIGNILENYLRNRKYNLETNDHKKHNIGVPQRCNLVPVL